MGLMTSLQNQSGTPLPNAQNLPQRVRDQIAQWQQSGTATNVRTQPEISRPVSPQTQGLQTTTTAVRNPEVSRPVPAQPVTNGPVAGGGGASNSLPEQGITASTLLGGLPNAAQSSAGAEPIRQHLPGRPLPAPTSATATALDAGAAPGASSQVTAMHGAGSGGDVSVTGGNRAVAPISEGGAQRWTVDNSQTVAGNIRSLIDENSPLMQQAQTRGLQLANRRGLINSSLAVGAAQGALYDAALPIAQGDASVNANAAQFNAGAANTASNIRLQGQIQGALQSQQIQGQKDVTQMQIAGQQSLAQLQEGLNEKMSTLQNEFSQQMAQLNSQLDKDLLSAKTDAEKQLAQQNYDNQSALAQQNYNNQAQLNQAQYTQQTALAQMDANNKVNLANIESNYKTVLQTSASASSLYSNTLAQITSVMQDPNMDAQSKQDAITNQVAALGTGLQMIGSIAGVDMGNLLNFGTTPAATVGSVA